MILRHNLDLLVLYFLYKVLFYFMRILLKDIFNDYRISDDVLTIKRNASKFVFFTYY